MELEMFEDFGEEEAQVSLKSQDSEELQESQNSREFQDSQRSEEAATFALQFEDGGNGASSSPKVVRSKCYKHNYSAGREQMPDFQGWLRRVVGEPTTAYCVFCKKTVQDYQISSCKHTYTIQHRISTQVHNAKTGKKQEWGQEKIGMVAYQENLSATEMEDEVDETMECAELTSDEEETITAENSDQESVEEEADTDEDARFGRYQLPFQKYNKKMHAHPMGPPIVTYVVDSTRGYPVVGMPITLYRLTDGRWKYINEGVTNGNGKFAGLLKRKDFIPGRYKIHFEVVEYFEARQQQSMYPFIEVGFDCVTPDDYYNIPVLLSPYGYSTFNGL